MLINNVSETQIIQIISSAITKWVGQILFEIFSPHIWLTTHEQQKTKHKA